jgi:hypothetical protein
MITQGDGGRRLLTFSPGAGRYVAPTYLKRRCTMSVHRYIKIGDFLTPTEQDKAVELYLACEADDTSAPFSVRCSREIIEPVIERINKKLGHENDPMYLAYCVEYACMMTKLKFDSGG